MQTIEEYKEYTKQLEGEVGKWHKAYDALMIERNQMAKTLCENKKIIETMATELEELRKHEVELDLAQARINELETENKSAKDDEINAVHQKSLARLEELVNKKYPDEEEDHGEADGILCDMLNALGYKDLTDAWDKIGKWYS